MNQRGYIAEKSNKKMNAKKNTKKGEREKRKNESVGGSMVGWWVRIIPTPV